MYRSLYCVATTTKGRRSFVGVGLERPMTQMLARKWIRGKIREEGHVRVLQVRRKEPGSSGETRDERGEDEVGEVVKWLRNEPGWGRRRTAATGERRNEERRSVDRRREEGLALAFRSLPSRVLPHQGQ